MEKTVIKFWAPWCSPCSQYAPTFEKVKEELQEGIEFVEINIDEDTNNLTGQYGVRGIPTTIIIQDGKKVKAQSGRMGQQELTDFILN